MRPSEVFERSRESAQEMYRIDDELEVLRSRVGGQGTGFGTTIAHSTVLDPTRSLDELLTREPELRAEHALCVRDVAEAMCLACGVEALGEADYADLLTRYYVYAHDDERVAMDTMVRVAAMRGEETTVSRARAMCDVMRRDALRYCDGIGIARLRGAAHGAQGR